MLSSDGAAVAFTYINSSQKAELVVKTIESKGGRALAICADIGDAEAVKMVVAETVRTLGRLDVLVNNAGIALLGTIDKFSLADFDGILSVNVRLMLHHQ